MNSVDKIGTAFLRSIFRRMKELGMNQTALAKRMNCSRAYISKVLQGQEVNFSFATAIRFAHALKMDFTPQLTIAAEDESGD